MCMPRNSKHHSVIPCDVDIDRKALAATWYLVSEIEKYSVVVLSKRKQTSVEQKKERWGEGRSVT